jgi:hypothetical protein
MGLHSGLAILSEKSSEPNAEPFHDNGMLIRSSIIFERKNRHS